MDNEGAKCGAVCHGKILNGVGQPGPEGGWRLPCQTLALLLYYINTTLSNLCSKLGQSGA